MNITEKVAYLKGLMEGLGFKPETPEQKILNSVVDILDDLAKSVNGTEQDVDYLMDYVDELDSDLGDVEGYLFADEDEDYDDEDDYEDDEDYYEDEDDDEDDDDEDEVYEFECPECGEKIYLSSALTDKQEITCPACSKRLTFDAEE